MITDLLVDLWSARLWPNKKNGYMASMESTEYHTAHHELFQPGITMGSDDDKHSTFIS